MQVGYARVSTEGQELRLQLDALKAAGCEKVFQEKAGGAKEGRPELDAAIEYAREGDVLVVWKLDRLGRSVSALVKLAADLDARGVGIRSLTDNVDTSGVSGRFFFHIMAAFAEMERGLMLERTRAGLKAARGIPKPNRKSKLIASKHKLGVMMFENGSTVQEVAEAIGCAPVTIYRHFTAAERKRPKGLGGRPPKSTQLELGMSA